MSKYYTIIAIFMPIFIIYVLQFHYITKLLIKIISKIEDDYYLKSGNIFYHKSSELEEPEYYKKKIEKEESTYSEKQTSYVDNSVSVISPWGKTK